MLVLELKEAMSTYIQFTAPTKNRGLALTYMWVCIFYNLGWAPQSKFSGCRSSAFQTKRDSSERQSCLHSRGRTSIIYSLFGVPRDYICMKKKFEFVVTSVNLLRWPSKKKNNRPIPSKYSLLTQLSNRLYVGILEVFETDMSESSNHATQLDCHRLNSEKCTP